MELTHEQLQALITAAVKAAKEPSAIEQRKIDAEEKELKVKQEYRLRTATSVKEDAAQKREMQLICTHEHRNGDTHMVFVHEQRGPGYLLCQKNQCKVRSGQAPEGYQGNDIYDTEMFNRCFQKIATGAEIFG